MFSPYVAEQVGWYVYALRNPLDHRVFYIGKGRGNRVFQHALDALAGPEHASSEKLDVIRGIHAADKQVEAFILRHGLATEKHAYEVESAVIDLCRLLDVDGDNHLFALTNAVLGHHHSKRGLAGVDVITSLYDPSPAPPITEPSLLIKIPGLWTPTMSASELYDATRRWWRVGIRREKAKYAFAVNHGVVRQVYAIDSWRQWTPEEADRVQPRFGFTGTVATEMADYVNTSVAHLYQPGEANPVRYLNC